MNRTLTVLPLALVVSGLLATPALASGGGGGVRASGSCSGTSDWTLKAKHEDGGALEVEAEVDSNRAGQTWTWSLLDDGVVVRKGTATTVAPSGSFTVRRVIGDRAGTDRIRLRAANAATGETCTGLVLL